MNTTIFQKLINGYNALSFTHNYIFGYEYKGNVYATSVTAEVLPYILKLDKASRGAGYALRFCPTVEQKLFLMMQNTTGVICSSEYFKTEVANSIYNNGEIFEKLVTEKFGQVWEKDNIPYTEAGDIEVDGVAYQIKFQKATFTNEKSLARMENM
ncbi:MAG: hypothetical protein IKN65_06260 [Clostridia bacterium]|nr:hypothetical protein [Clostridia bacterium]